MNYREWDENMHNLYTRRAHGECKNKFTQLFMQNLEINKMF